MDKGELCFTFSIQASFDCLKRSFERSFKQTLKDLCKSNFKSIMHEAGSQHSSSKLAGTAKFLPGISQPTATFPTKYTCKNSHAEVLYYLLIFCSWKKEQQGPISSGEVFNILTFPDRQTSWVQLPTRWLPHHLHCVCGH